MKNRRPLDLDAVLAAWPTAAHSPSAGFADRVLAACDAPVRAPRSVAGSSRWWFAAVAAAVILVPLFVLSRTDGNSDAHSSVASIAEPDLGTQRD